jgi:bifunctional non-homologous end joining protein LigD
VKHDGFRILVRKLGERSMVWSRRGADFTYRFPAIAEAVRGLAVDRALIDGEAVVLRDDGGSDFGALMTKRGGAQAVLVAFDLLRLVGVDQRLRPIEARREALMQLVDGVSGILFSEALAADGAVVFAKACGRTPRSHRRSPPPLVATPRRMIRNAAHRGRVAL